MNDEWQPLNHRSAFQNFFGSLHFYGVKVREFQFPNHTFLSMYRELEFPIQTPCPHNSSKSLFFINQ
jgi:hypothetical protein